MNIFKSLQHQFSLLQLQVQTQTQTAPGSQPAPLTPLQVDANPKDLQVQTGSSPATVQQTGATQCHPWFFREPKLKKITDSDDIKHFLITFERISVACQWPRSEWAF